jgi:rhodanese-related sulfurtransferase
MLEFLKKVFGSKTEPLSEVLERGGIILDVRSPEEYKQGHIKGSKNIPLQDVRLKAEMIKKWGKPVITVCRSGSRSAIAKKQLSAAGVETYNGGSWSSVNKIAR